MALAKSLNLSKEKTIAKSVYYALAEKPDFGLGQMVRAARFQGVKRVEFLDVQEFKGNMVRAIDWMISFVEKHTSKALVFDGQPQHKEFWQYPLQALREAMINALINRDLNDNCAVFLEIYDNRLEIANPGFLPKEIKEGSIFNNIRSVARNKGLAKIFSSLKLIESWGTGLKRIQEYCEMNGNPNPEIIEKAGEVRLVFRPRGNGGINGGINEVFNFIKSNPGLRAANLAVRIKHPFDTTEKWLRRLKKEGKIEYRGSKKTGGYFVK